MAEYRIRITRQASAHLAEIRRYIEYELLAPQTALKMIRALRTEIQSLSELPYRFKTVDEEPWRTEGVRRTQIKNYYVYYWINEEAGSVQVIGVIYVHHDQERQLQKMELE